MSDVPSLRRNYAFNVLLTVVNLAYPFLTLAWVARILGPGYLGKYYIASSLVSYFLFAASFGIPMYGAREIGRRRGDPAARAKVVAELAVLGLGSSLLAAAAYLAVVAAVPDFRAEWPLFLILGAMLPMNALSFDFLFYGLEEQGHIAVRSLVSKLASLVLLFALVRGAGDWLWYAAITTFGLAIHNLAALPAALRALRDRGTGLAPGRHLRPLVYIALTMLAANVYLQLDSVVLGLLTDERSVGLYNAATRLSRVAVAVLAAVGVTVLPRMTRLLESGDRGAYDALLARSFDFLCMLAVPVALALALAAPGIVRLVFGEGFAEAVPALQVASLLVLLTGLTSFLASQVLFPRGEERAIFLASIGGAAACMGLLPFLAPRFGPVGAAWAAVAAEAAVLAGQWAWIAARPDAPRLPGARTLRYPAAGAAMAAVLLGYRLSGAPGPLALAAALAGSGAVYFAVLAALREPLLRELAAAAAGRVRRDRASGGPP